MRFSTFVSAAAFFHPSIAGYVLEDDYMTDFYGMFDFFAEEDPTNGFVKYVDEATARQTNLINTSTTTPVQWGVDSSNQTPDGRPSIRIHSKKTYTHGLVVLDVAHMPFGCGTWPAFWMLGPDWPSQGEIDILEGVNDQTHNGMTLHTGPNCTIGSDTSLFAGDVTTPNCDVEADGQHTNVGCSIKDPSSSSYGEGLNAIGGGVYATEWTSDAISVYFFPRGSIPEDVLGDAPNPSSWGTPSAKFTGGCDIANMFKDHQIVFDTTFCGDWAGADWETGSCREKAPTCEEWVRDNPEVFAEAYWKVNALKVYKASDGEEVPDLPSGTGVSSVVSISAPVPTSATVSTSGYPVVSVPVPTKTKAVDPIITPSGIGSSTSGLLVSTSAAATITISTSETPTTTTSPTPSVHISSNVSGITDSSTPTTTPTPSTQPTTAPTGRMSGFQWPKAGQKPLIPNTSQSQSTALPISTSTSPSVSFSQTTPLTVPTPPQNIVQPSDSSETSPLQTNRAVKTVYETVYVTTTVRTVTATAIATASGTPSEDKAAANQGAKRRVEEQRRKRKFGRSHRM